MTVNSINKKFKEMIEDGAGIDEVIKFLQESEVSIIESIKIIKDGFGLSLKESKEIVCSHSSWKTVVDANKELHDEIIALINEK